MGAVYFGIIVVLLVKSKNNQVIFTRMEHSKWMKNQIA